MSTKTIARGIVGSLRLVGVSAAVAAGIAGFATVGASPAAAATTVNVAQFQFNDAQQAQISKAFGKVNLPQIKLPAKACDQMMKANVPADVLVKVGCVVISGPGPVAGIPIFS
ncbi:MAG: hypothetical protein JWP33_2220 [Blastococcus sp.]|jgi:hypothetical protein|nr:hypothetical protein [Blastococcus sp.]